MADMKSKRPQEPVRPSGVEIVYFYSCPNCERQVPLLAPVQPTMVRCDECGTKFPIVPADERGIRFFKIMTAEGKAGVDPDFL